VFLLVQDMRAKYGVLGGDFTTLTGRASQYAQVHLVGLLHAQIGTVEARHTTR
jgi:hypothetical protein